VTARPDIALCIFGQLRDDHLHLPGIAKLASDLGAMVFISTWRNRGRKTSGAANRDQLIRMFGYVTGVALPSAMVGDARFSDAVPEYEQRAQESLRGDAVTAEYLQGHFPGATVDIEDETLSLDFPAPRPLDGNSLRMLYKIWRCNELKRVAERQRGRPFDVVVRIRPDILPALDADVFAKVMNDRDPPVALFHNGQPDANYLDDVIAVSNSAVADGLAMLFSVALRHPLRPWNLIHAEIPRHLKDLGVVAGPVGLQRWVAEDPTLGPPRNRRLLFDLLEQNRMNPATFPNPGTWAAVQALLRAAAMVDDQQPSHLVEEAFGAIALERQDAEFLARSAFVLSRTHQAAQRSTDRVMACAAEALCSVAAYGPAALTDQRLCKEIVAMADMAGRLGIGEPMTWRALQRELWQAGPAPGLRRLLGAMQATLPPAVLLEAERAVATVLPAASALSGPMATDLAAAADLLAEGRAAEALQTLRAIAAAHPDRCEPDAWAGDIHLATGDLAASLDAYARAAGKVGAPADLAVMQSVCLEALGETAAAIAAARPAAAIAGSNTTFLRRLATLLADAGQHADAMPLWREVARRTGDPAMAQAENAARPMPAQPALPAVAVPPTRTAEGERATPAHAEKDNRMTSTDQGAAAGQTGSQATAPSPTAVPDVATAEDLVKAATARLQARDLEAAHELAAQCLERFPDHLSGYLIACEVARARQDRSEADSVMQRAIGLFPDREWTYAYHAYNALRERDFEVAAARYYDAVMRFPAFPAAARGLADSLAGLKLETLSAAVLDAAIRRCPPDKPLLMVRANVAAAAGDWNVAAQVARRVLEQFPDASGEVAELLARLPSGVAEPARRDAYVVLVQMPVATEASFHRLLDLALDLEDVSGAIANWNRHGWRWDRSARLDRQAVRLLRAALVAAVPADGVELLLTYLLTQPPAPSTAWYPVLLEVATTIRRAENHELFQRLASWVLPAIERLPSRGPVAYFVLPVLDPKIPYDAFEALLDQALPVMAKHNLWVKLFDRSVCSIEDSQRYVRRYVEAGYPLAPSEPIAALEGPDAARCLFLLAKARDPQSADALLQRFRQLPPPVQAEPSSWEAALPQIANRYILDSDPPAVVRRVGDRLKIGVCVSGQLRGFRQAHQSWSHLGWDAHDVRLAVHTWRNIGRRFPDNAAQLDRAFTGPLQDALIKVSALAGYPEILKRYPKLFNTFRQKNDVRIEDLHDVYATDLIEIEDDDRAPFATMQNQEKMYYKVEKCHDLLRSHGQEFDLVFRMRPDKAFAKPADVDWGRIHHASAARRELYADVGPFLVSGYGYCIGDQFAVGSAETMECYSRAWSSSTDPAMRGADWLPPMPLAHTSFAYATVRGGVRVKPMAGVHFGALITEDPLTPAQVRPLLLEDMNGVPRDDIDRTLLAACGD
jgi:tetratricopeptide (TPR) repeat protein